MKKVIHHDPHESPKHHAVAALRTGTGRDLRRVPVRRVFSLVTTAPYSGRHPHYLWARAAIPSAHRMACPPGLGCCRFAVALHRNLCRVDRLSRAARHPCHDHVRNMRSLYTLVFHKYYFDEIVPGDPVRPPRSLARTPVLARRRRLRDRRLRAERHRASMTRRMADKVSQAQTGYLYHYAFVMLIGIVGHGHLVSLQGLVMDHLPLLSLVTFLPLGRRRAAMLCLKQDNDGARALDRACATSLDCVRAVDPAMDGVRQGVVLLPVRGEDASGCPGSTSRTIWV